MILFKNKKTNFMCYICQIVIGRWRGESGNFHTISFYNGNEELLEDKNGEPMTFEQIKKEFTPIAII